VGKLDVNSRHSCRYSYCHCPPYTFLPPPCYY